MEEIITLESIEISVSKDMLKDLSYHYRIIQCITPNLMNLFSDEVNENLKLLLNEVLKIKSNEVFIANEKIIEELNNAIIFLRESLFGSSKFFKENYYNSFLGLLTSFTLLIKDYEKCKNLIRLEKY